MLINDVAKACGITRKAVEYYVGQGFVQPNVLMNGYRDFSAQDVAVLRRIGYYRKLGLSSGEIRRVLEQPDQISVIADQRAMQLEEEKVRQQLLRRLAAGESIDALEAEIDRISAGSMIVQRLRDMFPGAYGQLISLHFGRYLTDRIETGEQLRAFQQIIDFFDQAPAIDLPRDLQDYLATGLDGALSEAAPDTLQHMFQATEHALQNMDEFITSNRAMIDDYLRFKQTDTYKNLPAVRLMASMQQICAANGYYDVFIPAMRRLSPLYDRYYEQLLKADALFAQQYPDA